MHSASWDTFIGRIKNQARKPGSLGVYPKSPFIMLALAESPGGAVEARLHCAREDYLGN